MYDVIRWALLGLLFAGLFGVWFWSRRHGVGRTLRGLVTEKSFQIVQKRWLDQRTGICLVEMEEKSYLLAYTVGGGVSWQPVEPRRQAAEKKPRSSKSILLKEKRR